MNFTEEEQKQLLKNVKYWTIRNVNASNKLYNKSKKDIDKQLKKYYKHAQETLVEDFTDLYNKLLLQAVEGKGITPADLYKVDKYWQMQTQLKKILQELGDLEIALLSKRFEKTYMDFYNIVAIPSQKEFATVSTEVAQQAINAIWCSDGKTWSQRIWSDIDKLQKTLNDNLLDCVITGKKTTKLKEMLMNRFGVSYHNANTLVRTELCNIQTEATKKRYEDYGFKQYRFFADPDEKTCPICRKMDGKTFYYSEMQVGVNAPPLHPNDRCCIVPVID